MPKYLAMLLLPLALVGCSSKAVQCQPVQCPEPELSIRTNQDLAEAVLELQNSIRLCNALNGSGEQHD